MEKPKTPAWIVAAYALGSFFALPGPLLAVTVACASLQRSTHLFDAGHVASLAAAGTYAAALVALGVLGSLFLRGRAVPPLALYGAALAPYFVAASVAIFERHPIAFDLAGVRELLYAASTSQSGLAIGATMSAFAMMLVALAALARRASDPRASFGLLASATTSVILFAGLAVYAFERHAAFAAFSQGYEPAARLGVLTRALLAMGFASRACGAAVFVAFVVSSAIAARARGPGVLMAPSGSFLTMLALGAVAAALPAIVAAREAHHVRWTDPSDVAGIRLPSTHYAGRDPKDQTLAFITRDGAVRVDRSKAQPGPFGREDVNLVADRDVTYGALLAASESLPNAWGFSIYVAPAPDVRGDASALGDFATVFSSAATTVEVYFDASDRDATIRALLDGATVRIWRTPYVDKVAPVGNEPGASAARRAIFASIHDWHDYPFVIAPRREDTLETILQIVEDARSVTTRPLAFQLTQSRATPEERKSSTSPFSSYTTTVRDGGSLFGDDMVKKPAMTARGSLPPDVVDRIIRASFGSFRVCYTRGVARNAKLAGRIDMTFVIDPTGSVKSAHDRATLDDAAVVRCVVDAFEHMTFPTSATASSTTVATTLAFAPP